MAKSRYFSNTNYDNNWGDNKTYKLWSFNG